MATLIQADEHLATKEITPELLEYIVQKIVREINPQKIILFGSRGRGDFRPDSDIDLFIVYDGDEPNRVVLRRLGHLLWGYPFGVDMIVNKPEQVRQNLADRNPLYLYHIFQDGKVLYERR